ncbi:MAG: alkaline phosphatase [Verrucomicrobiales bacterium]|nr:alkaline phosphatase [Verrucomicrobiales bacterium]
MKKTLLLGLLGALALNAAAAPTVKIRLPERFRLLTGQRFDLRVEGTTLASTASSIQIVINGSDITAFLPAPEITTDNDSNTADPDVAWTYRSYSFPNPGVYTVVARVTDANGVSSTTNRIGVQSFNQSGLAKKNYILYIGDAMGTAYRDSGRIVSKSVNNAFREGFYDDVQEMDKMPYTGMVMTYASDNIVPDSANTATAWATGNKTINGTLNVFTDNTDTKAAGATSGSGNKIYALDNPRVETLWEYLKRTQGYKAGIVTTADVCDATPAGEGGHTLFRSLLRDIAKQYVDGIPGFTSGPEFDVIMGGGMENFTQRTVANSGDTRNLANDLVGLGFTYVTTRTDLNALPAGASAPSKLLGLFRTSNMNVAYDKLRYTRPTDEPAADFGGFNDQPFLEEMTAKAVATLSKGGAPFILMVEGASIDKQSHPNHAAGVIWDVIEFDKAIGVGRAWSVNNPSSKNANTLILVSADHDQSMSIVGLTDVSVPNAVVNTRSQSVYPRTIALFDPFIGNTNAANNAGNNVGEVTGFPNYGPGLNGYPANTNRYQIAVGFRTGNHTGSSVPITAEGPGASLFVGYFDQTDIFFKAAKVLSSSTSSIDEFQKAAGKLGIVSQNY